MCAGGAKGKSPPNISVVKVESSGPLWEGEGGKGIRLAVLALEVATA